MNWIDYQRPKTISDALTLLEQAEGRGRVIAGGTDLTLQLRRGEYAADLLVDITGIEELRQIREDDGLDSHRSCGDPCRGGEEPSHPERSNGSC